MKTNQTLKTRARNWIAGGLIGLTALVSGCGSNDVLIDKSTITKHYVETAFVSDYVARHGAVVPGQVRQDLINVNVNDRLSAFVWQNYSYDEKDFNERDFGFNYAIPLSKQITANIGYQYWGYPSGTFGKKDEVIEGNLTYKGPIDLKFDWTHLLPNDQGDFKTESGDRYYLKASKTFSLGKISGADVSITPSISTANINNFYGNSGLSQITPGINLGIQKGNLGINFFINKQISQNPQIDSLTWSGVSLGWKF